MCTSVRVCDTCACVPMETGRVIGSHGAGLRDDCVLTGMYDDPNLGPVEE